MREYLERRRDAPVLGVEIADMITDEPRAMTDWPRPILDSDTYRNTILSHTGYCLARREAFEGLRFSEEGPFGEPGWGVDDNEMTYRWNAAGIAVHACIGVAHPYRRASGSFERLYRETGIWPNQYGSVYEKRLVFCQQQWPQYAPGVQRGEPLLTVAIKARDEGFTARLVKRAHDLLRDGGNDFAPYSLLVLDPPQPWAEERRLRQHHGDTAIVGGRIVRRGSQNEATWTGDFRVGTLSGWREQLRPGARRFGLVEDAAQLEQLVARYRRGEL